MSKPQQPRRSSYWFGTADVAGMMHRASLRAIGIPASSIDGRPVVGICNSWSELVNCHLHLRSVAAAVKRGVLAAGGLPIEFPAMGLGEQFMKPTAMLYRNLVAMEVEESIRSNPLDAVVLLGGCDKSIPAQLMGAISANVPAVVLTCGPRLTARFRGAPVASGSDLWRFTQERRAGRMSEREFGELESALVPSPGHCMEMGTASTIAALVEGLGIALPGSATPGAMHTRRLAIAEETGETAVALAERGIRPRDILTRGAVENGIAVLGAVGGATNAIVHLMAIIGRLGLHISLDDVDQILKRTPLLVNTKPLGEYLFEDLGWAGGVPAVMHEILPLLNLDAVTVTGATVRHNLADACVTDRAVVRSPSAPLRSEPALAIVRGTLAPDGAVVRPAAVAERLRCHEGPALVFDGLEDMLSRIELPDLPITAESVLVLRGIGPVGGPGMAEWGYIPIPKRLLDRGVDDVLRISDGRVSGTVAGSVVAHVAPEAAVGGALAAVRDGDIVRLDLERRTIDLLLDPQEIERRLGEHRLARSRGARGYLALWDRHVLQADEGCDFDFLKAAAKEEPSTLPEGLGTGWLTGW